MLPRIRKFLGQEKEKLLTSICYCNVYVNVVSIFHILFSSATKWSVSRVMKLLCKVTFMMRVTFVAFIHCSITWVVLEKMDT